MKLTQSQVDECRQDGIVAGHSIASPFSGLIIQELVFQYDIWVKQLDRHPTDPMVSAWLEGLSWFLSGIYLKGAQGLNPRQTFDQRRDASKEQSSPGVLGAQKKMTTLRELALLLKMDRSAARRYVLKLGFNPQQARTSDSGYQLALVFTPDQVREIVEARRSDGYC
ncbi:hypothetical protein [Pseudomonas sp. REB1044]|uniref:hypothetical protein n=1 Tax=Pseudomonas sp. REB1044 TaxID=2675224 RepID=UPI00315CD320